VAAAYGLTPAETRLLESLLAGRNFAETATSLGIALTTAKTHLDRIFQKTGVRRQAELCVWRPASCRQRGRPSRALSITKANQTTTGVLDGEDFL
jgi:DNA-binding CsgD family transcriptional regulator